MEKHHTMRAERLIFRVSLSERVAIERASEAQGRTPSDFIRRALEQVITDASKQSDQ